MTIILFLRQNGSKFIRSGLIFIDFKDNLRETMTCRFPNKKRTEIPSIRAHINCLWNPFGINQIQKCLFFSLLKTSFFWQLCSENLAGNLLLVCTLSTLFLWTVDCNDWFFLKILSFYLYSCSGSNLLWFLLLFTTHQHYFTKWLQFSY